MKGVFKQLTEKQKRELLSRLFYVVLSGVLFITAGIVSFAWFSVDGKVNSTGFQVAMTGESADILIDRTDRYDTGYEGITGEGELKSELSSAGYSLIAEKTSESSFIAYELVNEYAVDGKYYMQPGAYGTVTFYIRPKTDEKIFNFSLMRGGYDSDFREVTSKKVKELLIGHILFFTEKTDDRYDGLLTENTFTVDLSAREKCDEEGKTDCYKIVLYWDWPIRYVNIINNVSNGESKKKYPSEISEYIENNLDCFFAVSEIYDEETKNSAYDDGDQMIGDAIDYFVLYLTLL